MSDGGDHWVEVIGTTTVVVMIYVGFDFEPAAIAGILFLLYGVGAILDEVADDE